MTTANDSSQPREIATLLPNGDILVPSLNGETMSRVEVGSAEHAAWLAYLQSEQSSGPPEHSSKWQTVWSVFGLLMPAVGLVAALVYLIRGQASAAGFVFLCALIGLFVYAMLVAGY